MFSADTLGFPGTKLRKRWCIDMGMYDKCPCRHCQPPERYPGCHGKCEVYAAWRQNTDDAAKAIRDEQNKDNQVLGFITESQRRVDKRLKIKK